VLTGPLRGRGYSSRDDADERPYAARLNERSARRVLGQPCTARPSDGPGQAVTDDPARRVLNDPGRALTDGPTQTQHVPNGLAHPAPIHVHSCSSPPPRIRKTYQPRDTRVPAVPQPGRLA